MTETIILANATLILPDDLRRGALVIKDGEISDILEGPSVPAGAQDMDGDMIAPGLIELHTDNLERHMQPRPKVYWPHDAAILAHDAELAGAGITTVFDAMRVGSVLDEAARYVPYARSLATKLMGMRAAGHLRICHFLHLRAEICSETLAEEMAAFGEEDRVGIVSLMDHTPGQRQFRDFERFRTYVMSKHRMERAAFDAHAAHLLEVRQKFGEAHEAQAVAEARRLGAVLASHDDTTAQQVATSAGHGIRLAEFPTTTEAAAACRQQDIAVMMGAPNLVRGGSHSGNVAAADLAEAGLLDILSSDYVPAALLTGAVRLGQLWGDLARGLRTVTKTPADAVGLNDRGRLVIGTRADLVRIRMAGKMPAIRGTWVQGVRV